MFKAMFSQILPFVLTGATYAISLFGYLMDQFGVYSFIITLVVMFLMACRLFGNPNGASDKAGTRQKRLNGKNDNLRLGAGRSE